MSDDRFDSRYYYNADTFGIQSTAGAIPVKNKKGEMSMKKVKVQRYICGKRPDYAADSSSSSESENDFTAHQKSESPTRDKIEYMNSDDPRLRRLNAAKISKDSESENDEVRRLTRHRKIHEPEILSDNEGEEKSEDNNKEEEGKQEEDEDLSLDSESSCSDDLDEEAISRRRELMRQRALMKAQLKNDSKTEILDKEEEKCSDKEKSSDEEENSDSEEDSEEDDEDDEEDAKLKPVFVRKKDRLTLLERERQEEKDEIAEREAGILAEQRKQQTLKMVEEEIRKTFGSRKNDVEDLTEVNTEDENEEEIEYESWKLRELKRMKRDREEREAKEKENSELERLRSLTEEERRIEAKNNPKIITNKAVKGKYKFMQKYYHRGAFFLASESNLLKRDVSDATLEDKFDRTVLPKVMQVKNFGRSGRTKYTHLVDQDTTHFDAAWSQETAQNMKFQMTHAGGMKQVFEKPSSKKNKR